MEVKIENTTTYSMSDMPPGSVGTIVDSQGKNIVVFCLPRDINGKYPVFGFGLDKADDFRHWEDKNVGWNNRTTLLPKGTKITITV